MVGPRPCSNTVQIAYRLLTYCKEKGIVITAHMPLGLGQTFLIDPVFLDIAKRRNAEVAQVVISWAVLQGTTPIPKSSSEQGIINGITVSDPCCIEPFMLTFLQLLKLSEDEMIGISQYHRKPGMHKTLCFPKLLKCDALQGPVLNGWKLEWWGARLLMTWILLQHDMSQ